MGAFQIGAFTKSLRNWLDLLGRARDENARLNEDAATIEILSDQLATVRGELARAITSGSIWKAKCEAAQEEAKSARDDADSMADQMIAALPEIEYARRQKANRARYDAKRRGK